MVSYVIADPFCSSTPASGKILVFRGTTVVISRFRWLISRWMCVKCNMWKQKERMTYLSQGHITILAENFICNAILRAPIERTRRPSLAHVVLWFLFTCFNPFSAIEEAVFGTKKMTKKNVELLSAAAVVCRTMAFFVCACCMYCVFTGLSVWTAAAPPIRYHVTGIIFPSCFWGRNEKDVWPEAA